MMVSKEVKMKWNSRNKVRYENFGYIYTKMRELFMVKVEHLPIYSRAIIEYSCDYCGEIKTKDYGEYLRQRKSIKKDCCNNYDCRNTKLKEVVLLKYGETNISKTKYFKDIYKSTMQEKYGVDNYFDIINKDRKSNAVGETIKTNEERIKQRKFPEYKIWRRNVFERDEYICILCGYNKGRILEAHHMDGWNCNIDRRLDISNGVTLCEKCHKKFHLIYRYGNNTQEQFYKFAMEEYSIDLKDKFEKRDVK